MPLQRCRLNYHRFKKTRLHHFCNEIENGIYSNPTVFVAPTLSAAEFNTTKETFFTAKADYDLYGITEKVNYWNARKAMFTALDKLAVYVNDTADGNVSTIALSGFTPTIAEPQKNGTLEKIDFFQIKHTNVSGELLIEIPAILNKGMIYYTCLCIKSTTEPVVTLLNGQLKFESSEINLLIDSNKSRKKKFAQLLPGQRYHFYVYATNTVSVSPISEVKSIYIS